MIPAIQPAIAAIAAAAAAAILKPTAACSCGPAAAGTGALLAAKADLKPARRCWRRLGPPATSSQRPRRRRGRALLDVAVAGTAGGDGRSSCRAIVFSCCTSANHNKGPETKTMEGGSPPLHPSLPAGRGMAVAGDGRHHRRGPLHCSLQADEALCSDDI